MFLKSEKKTKFVFSNTDIGDVSADAQVATSGESTLDCCRLGLKPELHYLYLLWICSYNISPTNRNNRLWAYCN